MMQSNRFETVILGAGLTGLSLAHYLRNQPDVLVLEKKERPGGVIQTRSEQGFTYETGPNTGIVKYGEVAELFNELQDYCEPFIPDDSVKKRYIWKKDRWQELPSGLAGGIKTPLFSWKDKVRILGEPFRKPGKDPEETLDRMVRRRLGRSFLNYAVDPFILGVYAGDPARIVPSYALPRLYNLEQDYGSFIGGAIKKKFEPKTELEKKATKDVFSMRGGLQSLVQGLYQSAGPERFRFLVSNPRVTPNEHDFEIRYEQNGEQKQIRARRVVTTMGAHDLPQTLDFLSQQEKQALSNLKYARVIQAAVGFRQWEGPELEGFGGLVPFVENRDILGALFMSAFLPNRAPQDGALLSVFMGGTRREDIYRRSDREIETIIERELKDMFRLNTFNPEMLRIMRYEHAIPQYGKESRERFEAIHNIQQKHNGLKIAGNVRDGIGMADRIKQAADLAGQLQD